MKKQPLPKSLVVLNNCMFSKQQLLFLKTHFNNVAIYNDTSSEEEAIHRIGNRNIVIMDQFMFTFSEKLLKACKNIELIIVNTTAYDSLNMKLLSTYNIKVANLRDYATNDVAETGIGMIFALNNKISLAQEIVLGADQTADIEPGNKIIPLIKRRSLNHQVIGIIGLGNIGRRSAELAQGLGMKVLGFNRTRKYVPGIEMVPLRKLLSTADIVYIALSYNPSTMKHFLNADLLSLIKKDALLVSVSHPDLLEMSYIINHSNNFSGIGFDYLVTPEVRALMKVRKDNIIITPHLGSQSIEAYSNMTETIIESAVSFAAGQPLYLVNT